MLCQEAIDDIKLFNTKNDIDNYYFWGQEKVLLEMLQQAPDEIILTPIEIAYFQSWIETPFVKDCALSDLYFSIPEDSGIVEQVVTNLYDYSKIRT